MILISGECSGGAGFFQRLPDLRKTPGSGVEPGLHNLYFDLRMSPIVDFSRITAFQWDEGNASKSEERHGVSRSDAEQVFVGEPLLIDRDLRHSQSEQRYNALGRAANGRLLRVTFTLRNNGAAIRVISARDMSRRERNRYAQET